MKQLKESIDSLESNKVLIETGVNQVKSFMQQLVSFNDFQQLQNMVDKKASNIDLNRLESIVEDQYFKYEQAERMRGEFEDQIDDLKE